MKKKSEVGLAILAGGLSSRMGQPKEELKIKAAGEEKTFLRLLCEKFGKEAASPGQEKMLAGGRYISENDCLSHDEEGYVSVKDVYAKIGPLGGIYSVLKMCPEEAVMFLACDMPKFSKEAACHIERNWDGSKACVAVVDGIRQPLAGIYTKACLPYIEEMVESGSYKLGILLEKAGAQMIDMSSFRDEFLNVNTENDYRNLKK